jgi:hypothetical protein
MAIDSSWTEPIVVDSKNPPEYPYNKSQQSESGHLIEMDDTPNRERVRVQHRAGTFLEMQPDGEVHKIYGNGYEIVLGDKDVEIKCINSTNLNINEIEDYLKYDSSHKIYNKNFYILLILL